MNQPSDLCIHTITTKPLHFEEACEAYAREGIRGITIWRDAIENIPAERVRGILQKHHLELVSYCRGGFFPHPDKQKRIDAIEENEAILNEAADIEAPLVVLVCGSHTGQSLETSRRQILDGIEIILPRAEQLGIKLAIEPLHPMYADTRSAINTPKQANDLADFFDSPHLGVAIDIYHLWWDPMLRDEIMHCGNNNRLFAFHISDWISPTNDILNDRGLMGEGCINIREISEWVKDSGFKGYSEVEVFSTRWWKKDQDDFVRQIVEAYRKHC